jgi:ferric-dicitrate binding protein FerR (iron transport regulator)
VRLEGEAFFEVTSAGAPFAVETHNARVEVLGTSFNVRAHANESETTVALVHGRVSVAATGATVTGARAAQLAPGETVVVGQAGLGRPARADIQRATAWRTGALEFEDRPLGDVLEEVERRYGVEIEIAAGTASESRVSAFYRSLPAIGSLLGDLGTAAGVRFTPTPDGYVVRPAVAETFDS